MAPGKAKAPQSNQRLKAVVRRLPPDLPQAVFSKTVEPWVRPQTKGDDEENAVAWSEFRQGIVRKSGKDKDSIHSRAYITFKTPEALVAFHRGYDGWSFKDKTGNVTQAVVEFAPYQRTPSAPSKPDPRQGTIDQDPDFLAFQTALTAPPDPADTPTEPIIDRDPKSTPLLEHLRAQKAALLATRKAAAAAHKKGKAVAKDDKKGSREPGTKNGKKHSKEKKNGKGGAGAKSKEGSRSGTPVPPTASGSGSGSKGTTTSRTVSGAGVARGANAQPPKSRDPPGVVYPPGSVGAQQQAAAKAQQAAAQQAQLVRQQLQRQHQQASRGGNGGGGGGGGGGNQASNAPSKPQPMILKNPSRQQVPQSNAVSATLNGPSTTPSSQPNSATSAQVPKGPKADVAGQRRQVGAAIGAALNEGVNSTAKRGRGRGAGGGGRGGGPSTRGGRGRGRGGAANVAATTGGGGGGGGGAPS